MFGKQAQGMSINTIIIAIIVLIVLVILVAIFGGYIKGFSSKTSSCASAGGTCIESASPLTDICANDAGSMTSPKINVNCPDVSGKHYLCCPPAMTKTKAPI
jgi:hypothetical protein